MNIVLFKDLTTDELLADMEAKSEEYNGLYVDMEVAKERKYVKDNASGIKDIIKAVKASSIKMVKDYRLTVKAEEDSIITRLEKCNEPFTLLIDDHDAARKLILDAEKEKKRQEELYIQIGLDHEFALLLDKSHAADKAEAERFQKEYEEGMRLAAEKSAEKVLISRQAYKKDLAESEERARLADKEHVRGVNRDILAVLQNNGVGEFEARTLITLAAQGKLPHLTINY